MKKLPKYEKIYRDLKEKILKGSFPNGKLPPIAELTSQYDASLLTVNNAVKLLAEDNIVSRGSGRSGTRINQPGLRNMNLNSRSGNSWTTSDRRRVTLRYLTEQGGIFIPDSMPMVIHEFEERYSWIHVEQDFTNSIDFLNKSDHDIIQASHSAILPLIRKKGLLDLTPYFEKFGRKNRCLHDDCTVPLMLSIPFFFSNDPKCKMPQTWKQLAELNAGLKKEGKRSAMLLGFFSILHFFIGDICNNLFAEDKKESFAELISILQDYYHWEMPWNNLAPSEIFSAVQKNKISFFSAYAGGPFLEMSTRMRIAPLPDCGQYLAETIRIGINRECQYPAEAWLFINYLRSKEVQKRSVDESHGIPYHEEVFHSDFKTKFPELYNNAAPLFTRLIESSVSENARDMIYHVAYSLLEKCFSQNIPLNKCTDSLKNAIHELIILDQIENNR